MFSDESKTLLKNVLRHTKTHNRLLEEADMWKQLEDHRGRPSPARGWEDHRGRPSPARGWEDHRGRPSPTRGSPQCKGTPIRGSPKHDGRRHMDRGSGEVDRGSGEVGRAHMDEEPTEGMREESSTYWRRHLLKVEEDDPGRWGHSGFKELYKEFDSDAAQSDDKQHTHVHGAKEKCKKKHEIHKGKTTKEKNKSSHKGKHHRHRCKTTDGAVSEDEESRKKRSKRRKTYSDRYAWVEKPVATPSEELPGNRNNLQCSNSRVEDGHSVEISGHHVTPAQTDSSTPNMNHKLHMKHSSSHKTRHRKRKSKHKSSRKRKRDSSSVDSTSVSDT